MAGKFAIGLYIGRSGIGSSYGAAGSLVVLLVWVYYSAQILFFGAEFTKVYANRRGSRISPSPNAERVTERGRAEQGIPKADAASPTPHGSLAHADARRGGRVELSGMNTRIPVWVDAASPTPAGPSPRASKASIAGTAVALASIVVLSVHAYLADRDE